MVFRTHYWHLHYKKMVSEKNECFKSQSSPSINIHHTDIVKWSTAFHFEDDESVYVLDSILGKKT